jgi:CheY-like chemotaxis protein
MIHIVLADDHPGVRKEVRVLLASEQDFSILGEARDGLEAMQVVEALQPHVLVVDITMPGLDGLNVTRRVRKRVPATQVVVLSVHAQEAYVSEALRSGALGYVLKDEAPTDLVKAVRQAARGKRFLSAPFVEHSGAVHIRQAQAEESFEAKPNVTVSPDPSSAPDAEGESPLLHILLVEDNAVNQQVALRMIKRLGCSAEVATNGRAAVAAVHRRHYDIVLMDVQMPEMDGLEATRRIRADLPAAQQPRIIALTANALKSDRELCLEAGMSVARTRFESFRPSI